MEAFKVQKEENKMSSINRTIRLKPDIYARVEELTEQTGVSFNKIINQCVEYALHNMKSEE